MFHTPILVEFCVGAIILSSFTRLLVAKGAPLKGLPQLCLYAKVFGSENTIF